MYKKLFLLFGIALTISLTFNSCIKNSNQSYINKIDSTINVVNILKADFEQLNTDSINIAYSKVLETIAYFKKNLKDTEPDSTFLRDFSKYTLMQKQFKKLTKNLSAIESEIILSEKQLKDLRKDVRKNLLTIEEIERYTNEELQIVNQLTSQLTMIKNLAEKSMRMYIVLQPVMEDFNKNL